MQTVEGGCETESLPAKGTTTDVAGAAVTPDGSAAPATVTASPAVTVAGAAVTLAGTAVSVPRATAVTATQMEALRRCLRDRKRTLVGKIISGTLSTNSPTSTSPHCWTYNQRRVSLDTARPIGERADDDVQRGRDVIGGSEFDRDCMMSCSPGTLAEYIREEMELT